MTPNPSPALRVLLEAKLDTYEKLELVLALRAAPEPIAVTAVALQLQIGTDVLRRVLDDVTAAGLAELLDDDRAWYVAGAFEAELTEAAELYRRERATLVRVFSSIAMDRIRAMSARSFADAFRIRRKDGT